MAPHNNVECHAYLVFQNNLPFTCGFSWKDDVKLPTNEGNFDDAILNEWKSVKVDFGEIYARPASIDNLQADHLDIDFYDLNGNKVNYIKLNTKNVDDIDGDLWYTAFDTPDDQYYEEIKDGYKYWCSTPREYNPYNIQ